MSVRSKTSDITKHVAVQFFRIFLVTFVYDTCFPVIPKAVAKYCAGIALGLQEPSFEWAAVDGDAMARVTAIGS